MKAGVTTIVVGIIFIFGAFAAPAAIVLPLILPRLLGDASEEQFKVPGRVEVMAEEPGRYYLWNDYQTVFRGKTYNRSKSVPDGMEIRITHAKTGEPFDFVSDTSISSSSGANSKNTIGYVEVKEPCRVAIEVSGGEEERVFSFSPFRLWRMLKLILGGFALSFVLGVAGVGVTIWGIVKVARAGKTDEPVVPAVVDKPNS